VTARPRHLRLIATSDDVSPRATRGALVDASWGAPSPSVAHAGLALPLSDARSSLLLEAARTVLPPRPPVLARVSADADGSHAGEPSRSPWGSPERTKTCRPLVLSGAQLAFLEDLALLRRSRSFRCDEGPAADALEHDPEAGSVYVRRLLRPKSRPRGTGEGQAAHLVERRGRPSTVQRFVEALRVTFVRCANWVTLAARPRGVLGGDSGRT
jgi:hypothetical protein